MCSWNRFNKNDEVEQNNDELEEILKNYEDVFPEKLPQGLPPERNIEMKIQLMEGAKPTIGPIYKLSVTELAEMKKKIEAALANGFIRPSVSPWGHPRPFHK